MKYCCTQCGAINVRAKTKSNYGFIMSVFDFIFFIAAFFTWGVAFLGCLIIHCCVKKTKVCRKCGCENCLIPAKSPRGKQMIASQNG